MKAKFINEAIKHLSGMDEKEMKNKIPEIYNAYKQLKDLGINVKMIGNPNAPTTEFEIPGIDKNEYQISYLPEEEKDWAGLGNEEWGWAVYSEDGDLLAYGWEDTFNFIIDHYKKVNERMGESQKDIFTNKNNPSISIIVTKGPDGRILSIDKPRSSNVKFPFVVGQIMTRNIETWACNNNFLINEKDPCPEQKIFGIKASDVPRGHELRRIFPNKFR